jgi:site-specific DNA-methyltransferase (adenine-specific)/modification methylase
MNTKNIDQYLNKIIQGDCIEELKNLPANSVDLIFADPPYNLQLGGELYRPNQTIVNAVNDEWDKFVSFEEYDKFSVDWLKECKRVLKKNGAIWVIGSYHNIFRIGKIMQDLGFWVLNDIIWIKTNPMPNFKGTRFNNAHETLIWASQNKDSKYVFHYKSMKVFNDDKQMRSDWYIPICNGRERIYIDGKKAHSTQKPEALLHRIILSTSNLNDIILDPFMGSGTTGAVAKKLKRNFIGIEKEKEYIKIALDRIDKVLPIDEKYLSNIIEAKKPKVPLSSLIESNFIKPGEKIYSKDKKYEAVVLSNSSILFNKKAGSIHSISAEILNKSANNGWDFWYVLRNGKLISIDKFRNEYNKKYIIDREDNFGIL